jgi:D-alanyl-D-alanine carboxypeptidase
MAHADKVDDYIRKQMQSQSIPGLSVAVIRNGKPIKVKAYGLANLELDVPATTETVYRIGSVSKPFIATAAMLLVQDSKLSLDDKAARYLEGAPPSWDGITVRQLLAHTSGLIREAPGYSPLKSQSDTETIKSAYGTPLAFEPGSKFLYSNLGYFVLAEVITKTAGQPWPTFVRDRILKPLGMEQTSMVDGIRLTPHRADGYNLRNDTHFNGNAVIALRPSGALMSNILDMIKWNNSLDNATLLSQDALDQMWKPGALNDGSTTRYGFGWQLGNLGSHRTVGHAGALYGFSASILRFPDEKLSVIVLTNLHTAPTDGMAASVAAQYINGLLPKRRAIRLTSEEFNALTGRYRIGSRTILTVANENGKLRARAPAIDMNFLLQPFSKTELFDEGDLRYHFVAEKDESGKVLRLVLKMGDEQVMTAVRAE